jgi:hypothetical protein
MNYERIVIADQELRIKDIFNGRMERSRHHWSYTEVYQRFLKRVAQKDTFPQDFHQISTSVAQRLADLKANMLFCIPMRCETRATEAIAAIRQDCQDTQVRPFFIGFHNYVDEPSQQTQRDVDQLQQQNDVVFLEEKVPSNFTIGQARSIPTHVALAATNLLAQEGFTKDMLIASADADITSLRGSGNYQRAMQAFDDAQQNGQVLDGVGFSPYCDLKSVAQNAELLVGFILENFLIYCINVYAPQNRTSTGAASIFRARSLCELGSYPSHLTKGEDLVMRPGFATLRRGFFSRPKDTYQQIAENGVFVDVRKMIGRKDHYENWEQQVNTPKPHIPQDLTLNSETYRAELLGSLYQLNSFGDVLFRLGLTNTFAKVLEMYERFAHQLTRDFSQPLTLEYCQVIAQKYMQNFLS